jgi:hypothetical protein
MRKFVEKQENFCTQKGAPMFAPTNGRCFRCKKLIYTDHPENQKGYTLGQAGDRIITGCPHCHASFVD